MPAKLNVGFSRKLGRPDFGSVGASCSVEFELDDELQQTDLEAFHERARAAYAACRQAVQDELALEADSPIPLANRCGGYEPQENGHSGATQNGVQNGVQRAVVMPSQSRTARPASDKQLGFLRQLASRTPSVGLRGLDDFTQRVFGKPCSELASIEASNLIEMLKGTKAGVGAKPGPPSNGVGV